LFQNKYYKQFAHRKNNSEYNDDRRQRNRATHNINRANKRIEDLDYRRDPYLSKTSKIFLIRHIHFGLSGNNISLNILLYIITCHINMSHK